MIKKIMAFLTKALDKKQKSKSAHEWGKSENHVPNTADIIKDLAISSSQEVDMRIQHHLSEFAKTNNLTMPESPCDKHQQHS